ncbi:FtsX-like permease family protein [Candidatus Pantoea multigeneris]|uniref:FtsX-like permease family protein n=1 Tax=Candidatus Pantoea multigeneris TaxID=2608357 RepID=A0ABX0R6F5_9GAMM|nr:FtsX-like permease family protein [Pantoea multigeneris]NIF20359.1 FtsX-like permease family protein [Pantoea multigeneris]
MIRWVYIVKSVCQHRVRLFLISVFVIAGFATLQVSLGLSHALSPDRDQDADKQLLVLNGINSQMPLPEYYQAKIAVVPGVNKVSFAAWTGAYFRHPAWTVPALAVDEQNFFSMNPELHVSAQALSTWHQQKNGVLVDKRFAERYDLQVGGRLPLQSAIWPVRDSGIFDLVISGLVSNSDSNAFPGLYFHYDYFQDRLSSNSKGLVSYFMVTPNANTHASELAKTIDALFDSNLYQGITQTATKNIHMQQLLKRMFDIRRAISFINISVFILLAILLIANLIVILQKNAEEYGLLYLSGYQKQWIMVTAVLQQCAFILPGSIVGSLIGLALVIAGKFWGPLALTGLRLTPVDFGLTFAVATGLIVLALPAPILRVMALKGRSV